MRYDNAHPDNLCRLSNSSHFVRKFRLNRIFISSNLIKRIDYKLYRSKVEYKDKYFSTIHSFHRKKRKSIKSKKYSSSSKENSSLKSSSEIWQKSAASIHSVFRRDVPVSGPFSYPLPKHGKDGERQPPGGWKEVRRMRGRKKKKKRKGEEREGWIKRSWWRVWGGKGCKQRIKRGTDCEGVGGRRLGYRMLLVCLVAEENRGRQRRSIRFSAYIASWTAYHLLPSSLFIFIFSPCFSFFFYLSFFLSFFFLPPSFHFSSCVR